MFVCLRACVFMFTQAFPIDCATQFDQSRTLAPVLLQWDLERNLGTYVKEVPSECVVCLSMFALGQRSKGLGVDGEPFRAWLTCSRLFGMLATNLCGGASLSTRRLLLHCPSPGRSDI